MVVEGKGQRVVQFWKNGVEKGSFGDQWNFIKEEDLDWWKP